MRWKRIANDPDLKHLIPQEDGKKRGIGHRCFISACKVRPVPYGLCKAGPFGFRGKIILAALAVFFPESLAQSGTERRGRQENKISALQSRGMSNSKNKKV